MCWAHGLRHSHNKSAWVQQFQISGGLRWSAGLGWAGLFSWGRSDAGLNRAWRWCADVQMFWHPQGTYLAVQVDRFTKSKKTINTSFELFSLKVRQPPPPPPPPPPAKEGGGGGGRAGQELCGVLPYTGLTSKRFLSLLMYRISLTTGEHRAVIAPQDRNTPAEVLELPTKTDRIHHFAWEPRVSAAPAHPPPMHGCRATAGHQSDAAPQDLTPATRLADAASC